MESTSPYDLLAEAYAADTETSAWNALYERPATLSLLPPLAGKRVLEPGCGSGALTARLVERGASVLGFDASSAMLDIAERSAIEGATFRVADLARPLDFLEDRSFDVIVASLVLHYLRDWSSPLRELRRVLRDDGTFVFSTHHPAWDVTLGSGDYFATELIHDRWIKGGREFPVDFWRRPLTDMIAPIREAGFAIDALTEPAPVEECRERAPEEWEKLTSRPAFLFFRLLAA